MNFLNVLIIIVSFIRIMKVNSQNLSVLDVVTIEKTGEFFRLIYDMKGRFTIHRITAEEAKVSFG